MARIRSYHRPETLDDALALLARPDVLTAPLGGGTVLNGLPEQLPEEVVDLQALELDDIAREGSVLTYGAMVRVQDLADHDWTPPSLRDLALRSAPNTIRNAATIGGTVAGADWENTLLAGLVAWNASVTITDRSGTSDIPLADLLSDRSVLSGAVITGVSIDVSGSGGSAGTGRTPADVPIVLVAGHRNESGDITLAATGIAATPVQFDLAGVDDLDPPTDFRGSPEYRRHLAATLGARVVAELEGGAS